MRESSVRDIVEDSPVVRFLSPGSIRVVRTEEGTYSTRLEMTDLLEVLIGANVKENLVVMVDNQSILRRLVDGLTRGTQPSCLYR